MFVLHPPCLCACGGQRLTLGVFLTLHLTFWERKGFSLAVEPANSASRAGQQATGIFQALHPQCWFHTQMSQQKACYMGAGDPNSCPNACIASTSLTKQSPQPARTTFLCNHLSLLWPGIWWYLIKWKNIYLAIWSLLSTFVGSFANHCVQVLIIWQV